MPWVLFTLQDALFAIHSSLVTEMVITPEIRPVPQTPRDLLGMVNLRGRILPLYDLRLSFGMTSSRDEDATLVAMLEERKIDHVRWLEALEHSVRTDEPFTLALDPHQCAFGKWYDRYRAPNVLIESHLKRFEAPHARIHALGGEMLDWARRGDREAALAEIERQRNTTLARMAALFDAAKDIVHTTHREIAVVLTSGSRSAALMVDAIDSVEHLRPESIGEVSGLPAAARVRRTARTARGDRLVMLVDEDALAPVIAVAA